MEARPFLLESLDPSSQFSGAYFIPISFQFTVSQAHFTDVMR